MKRAFQILFLILFYTAHGQAIDPGELPKNVGKSVTLYGMIYDGKYLSKLNAKPTFLDFGGRFPNQIATIVIEDSNRANFSYKPEEFLKHRTVWVTGLVSKVNDQYRLKITDSKQIKVDSSVAISSPSINNSFIDNVVFTQPENTANFPGGADAWDRHVKQCLNNDLIASEELKPGSYPVKVQFVVKADSTITNVKAYPTSDGCRPCISDALRLIKNSPKWAPATQNGVAVNSLVVLTVYRKVGFPKERNKDLLDKYSEFERNSKPLRF